MTVRINKQKINLREKLTEFEDKVNFDEVVRGLGEYTGNVGIGTTNPEHQLHIKNDSGVGDFKIEGTQPRIWLKETDQTDLDILIRNHAGQFRIDVTKDDGNLVSTPFLINNTSGNVGIGIADPGDNKLRIYDSDAGTAGTDASPQWSDSLFLMRNIPNNYQGTRILFAHGRAAIGAFREDFSEDGSHHLSFFTGSNIQAGMSERMRIKHNGNVGIGTTDPGTNKLYVNGSIYASGTITPSSDDRVKHNEQAIVGAIETLGKLSPKKYIKTTEMYEADHDFELDADGNPVDENGEPVEHSIEAGVIAQQVLEVPELAFMVSPEGVDEDGNVTSPHGLNYNSLFTYAIAAIQEQQQIIEDLKSRIETLESK